jgi:hypothetical protein
MIDMIGMLYAAWRQNLECGDKSRAVRGSRHRFLSAPYAETHLVSTPSRLPQRRSVSTRCVGRSVGTKCALRFLVLSTDLRRFFFLSLTAGWEGRASARPRVSRRLPLPALRAPGCRTRSQRSGSRAWAVPPMKHGQDARATPLRLCVSALKKRSTFCGRGRPRSRLRTHKTRTRLACSLSLTDCL